MDRYFSAFASRISHMAGQPAAFILALLSIAIWGATGPLFGFSDTWQLVVNTSTTIVTFLMVFVIQNAQNRDAAALQAKLDEVIRSIDNARNRFIGIEHLTDTQIEEIRSTLEEESGQARGKASTTDESVEQLLKRF